jgi:uncharacterized membrane-anchored protein YitT (DUF2179 family)
MIYIVLNAIPIIAGALAGLGFANIWYRKRLPLSALAILFAANLWLAAILAGALILAPPKGGIWTMTIGSAVVAPALVGSYQVRKIKARSLAADCGYWLVTMVAQAVIMRIIGLVAPPVA